MPASLGLRMLLEEFHDDVRRGGGKFMSTRTYKGNHGCVNPGRVESAAFFVLPRLAVAALIQFAQGRQHPLLPRKLDQGIVLASDMEHGLGFEARKVLDRDCGGGGEGGEFIAARGP